MITAPGGLPLAGHAFELVRRPLQFLDSLRDLGEVVRFRLGTRDCYLVTTPDAVREVQITQLAAFDKGGLMMDVARSVVGQGLATAEGSLHRRTRKMAQPAFHHTRIAVYAETMARLADERTASWRPGQQISMTEEMHTLSAQMLGRTLITTDEDVPRLLSTALPEMLGGLGRRVVLPFGWLHRLPLPVNRRYEATKAAMDDKVRSTIAEYRAHPGDRGDLLSMLIEARDEDGEPMSDEQLRDEVYTMMFAGVTTSAESLVWLCYELARQPAWRSACRRRWTRCSAAGP